MRIDCNTSGENQPLRDSKPSIESTAVSNATSISAQIRASRSPMPVSLSKVLVDGQTVEGSNIAGSVLRVGGSDGSFARTFKTTTGGALAVTPDPAATGATAIAVSSAASTNATTLKASAGSVLGFVCSNNGAAVAYLKFYNKASTPTVGTDVPFQVFSVPAGGQVEGFINPLGGRFTTGISFGMTMLVADGDTTAVAATQLKFTGLYI